MASPKNKWWKAIYYTMIIANIPLFFGAVHFLGQINDYPNAGTYYIICALLNMVCLFPFAHLIASSGEEIANDRARATIERIRANEKRESILSDVARFNKKTRKTE